MAEFVRVERDGAIATIRFDRPPVNALSTQLQDEIAAAAGEAGADPAIRAVVVYGGGKVFAAGADIKELASASYPQMAADSRRLQAAFTAAALLGPVRDRDRSAGMRSFIENGPGKATFTGR